MSNHFHLLIETPEPNLSRGMRQLNGMFSQEINRIHYRVGHLFQGRFKAILIEKEEYLLEVSRYIVLNPVRAYLLPYTTPNGKYWAGAKTKKFTGHLRKLNDGCHGYLSLFILHL